MHGNGGAALGQRGLCTFRSRSLATCHVGESRVGKRGEKISGNFGQGDQVIKF